MDERETWTYIPPRDLIEDAAGRTVLMVNLTSRVGVVPAPRRARIGHLAAAAPALYAALKVLMAHASVLTVIEDRERERAHAALKKAEGR